MKRLLGVFLVFFGLLLLLRSFQPQFYNYLLPYAQYIKQTFWGVTLLIAGLYILIKNRNARTLLGVVFILYLALYLVTPETSFRWHFSFREAGDVKELGEFQASKIDIENIAAEISIVRVSGDGIKVLSNLPLRINEGDVLEISCSGCPEYRNGKLFIKVGEEADINSLTLRNTVGDVDINIADVTSINIENVIGDFKVSGSFSSLTTANFVGEMEISLERCPDIEIEGYCSQIGIYRGSGEVTLYIPDNIKVAPEIEGSLTSITIDKGFEVGEKTLKLTAKNFVGKIIVE
ncbi:hypothetical protein K1720_06930 [Thermococcus argininiproducens]|uniref:Uncharacterized protein n=1 Tax=Thermococcus argininiproducens TaxID=2866384 RepID=A0A9E7SBU9_9EURY|nr:hypothetical protein [Thermococcus argininiproducens]USG99273.1 hypothetical protein K1720_06930 [Thermococcus argininiproducens]